MWNADELYEGTAGLDRELEGRAIERITDDDVRHRARKLALGAPAHERPDGMSALEQPHREPAADVSRCAGEEHGGQGQ